MMSAGIIWPDPIAPFNVVLVPLNLQKSARVRAAAEALYEQLCAAGIEVLYDDRDARPGVKFADAELLGIPHRIVVGERGLDAGTLEYRHRRGNDSEDFAAAMARWIHSCAPAALAPPERHDTLALRARAALTRWLRHAAPRARPRASRRAQQDPELRAVVQQAITPGAVLRRSLRFGGVVHADGAEAAPLREATPTSGCEILQTVYCETHRRGGTRAAARAGAWRCSTSRAASIRWAVSSAGAVGLMQVMPFWPEQLGMRRYELTRVERQHPHGLRDPALLPATASGATFAARSSATTAASAAATIPTA